jgi:hypothetical protein
VHPIEASHKRALAAPRRSNQRSCVIGWNIQVDVLQRVVGSIPCVQVRHLNADTHVQFLLLNFAEADKPGSDFPQKIAML